VHVGNRPTFVHILTIVIIIQIIISVKQSYIFYYTVFLFACWCGLYVHFVSNFGEERFSKIPDCVK